MQGNGTHQRPSPIQYRIGSLDNPRRFKDQDFESLRNFHLKEGHRFKDDTFPADISVIGNKLVQELNIQHLEWKRPTDLCKEPHLFVDGVSLFDIRQSALGDCWVLSTMGALAIKQKFLWNLIPSNQGYTKKYAGIFHFRFWHFGKWVDVVIDDQLPFLNGNFLSVQPCSKNEFWPCLVEKAYAKLQGSYQNLHWGDPSEAFVNFTGGVVVEFALRDQKQQLFDLWKIASLASHNALMGATIVKEPLPNDNRRMSVPVTALTSDIERLSVTMTTTTVDDQRRSSVPFIQEKSNPVLKNGLVQSHAYTVTGTAQVQHAENGQVNLIRLWNPWCRREWNGPWSDESDEWNKVGAVERNRLLEKKDNGEFWMPWDFFKQEFTNLYICNSVPDYLDFGDRRTAWYKSMFYGLWNKQSTATTKDVLWMNPQYAIRVTEEDEVKIGYNVVVTLTQNPNDRPKFITSWLPIGFKVLKIGQKGSLEKMPQEFFSQTIAKPLRFHGKRELTSFFQLTAGTYLIVPFTMERDKDLTFMLRIFLKSVHCAEELGSTQNSRIITVSNNICGSPNIPQKREDNIAETMFAQYADQGLNMNAFQLRRILNEVFLKDEPACYRGEGFSLDASRGILAVMDYTMSGTLSLKAFRCLWSYLQFFKETFKKNDEAGSGFLDKPSFRNAVQTTGLGVDKVMLQLIFHRYGDSSMRINLIDYLCCIIRFKMTSKTLRFQPHDGQAVYLNHGKLLQLMIYH